MPSKPLKAIRPMFQRGRWSIVRGDHVQITAGKDKGLQGRVLAVFRDPRRPRVVVEGRNLMRKRIRAQADSPGFEVVMEAPLHYSNVMLVDPVSRKPVRSRAAWTESGDKTRVGVGRHASGAPIPKPRAWLQDAGPDTRVGAKDTPPEEALRVTRRVGGGEGEDGRPDYAAGRLAPPRPAWLPPPAEGGAEAAEEAALAYEERVEAWARRAYERGMLTEVQRREREAAKKAAAGGGQQQQVRRASTLAAAAAAGEEERASAAAAVAAAAAAPWRRRRQWILERTGAPGLGPLAVDRLSDALSSLLLRP